MPSASPLQQLGSGSLPFAYSDFGGGLNTYDKFDLLQDNQARDLQNLQSTTAGAMIKRGGLQQLASLAAIPISVAAEEPGGAIGPLLVVMSNGSVVYVNNAGSVSASIGTLATTLPWEWAQAPAIGGQGPFYGVGGSGAATPQQWQGPGSGLANWTATDAGGTVPKGQWCLYANNQMFIAGDVAHPSRLYWSGIGDPTAWNPANLNGSGFMDLDPADGSYISGIGRVGPYILVGKPRKLFVLIDPANAQTRRLSTSVGIASHRSIAEAPEGTYFLSQDRVYRTNGSKIDPISDKIQPTIDAMSPTLRAQCAGIWFDRHYYLSIPAGGSNNDTTLDYDTVLQSWWRHTFGASQFAIANTALGGSGTLAPALFAGLGTSALLSRCFVPGVFQDNGSNFTWRWSGPWQSPTFYRRRRFPTTWERKRLRQIRLSGLGQVDLSLAKADPQLNPSATLVRSDVFSNSSFNTRSFVYGQGVARAFSLIFSGTYNSYAEIDEYVLSVLDRRDRLVS